MNTLARCQLGIVALYRQRAHRSLMYARAARHHGHIEAARGLLDEALLWRVFSNDWARKARNAQ